jgi:DNA end-binding protein Ku
VLGKATGPAISSAERKLGEQLVAALAGPFDPGALHDDYREKVEQWIAAKQRGRRFRVKENAARRAPAATSGRCCGAACGRRRGAVVPQREGRARAPRGGSVARDREESAAPGPRAIWSGSLSFGLVTVPVELFSAQRSTSVPLRMLSADGTPLVREYVCPKEEKPLTRDEIVRGYDVGDDEFVVVTDEELPRSRRGGRATSSCSASSRGARSIPPGSSAPTTSFRWRADQGLSPARRDHGAAGARGIARFVMRDRAYAIAISPTPGSCAAPRCGSRTSCALRRRSGLPEPGKIEAVRVRAVEKAVSALAARDLSEEELRDDGSARLLALAREKRKRGGGRRRGARTSEAQAAGEGSGEVVDLMELLKQRLGVRGPLPSDRGRSARPAPRPPRGLRRSGAGDALHRGHA